MAPTELVLNLTWASEDVCKSSSSVLTKSFLLCGAINRGNKSGERALYRRLQTVKCSVSQADWKVSSLDPRDPDEPSCPVLNSGLALSKETLASHDSWDQDLMSAKKICLIWRIALLTALLRRGPRRDAPDP